MPVSAVMNRITALLCLCASFALSAASMAPVAAEHGMVVSAQHLATRVGVQVLREGGNAIDAAVAVGYALAVVYPAAGNLGGGGFITLQLADGRKSFIDFRETAPLKASVDMFVGADGKADAQLSTRGHLAVAVPGTVAGLELAREKYGSRSRKQLLAPAIALAERGFVLDQGDVAMLAAAEADLRLDPASAAIFVPDGRSLQPGDRLVQKELGQVLRRIAREGVAGFYQGKTATALVKASQTGGGILSLEDLRAYKAVERAPLECDYRGLRIVSAPPPSSGGVVLCQILGVLEGWPLAEYGYGSAQGVHYQIEAMRHAYADRLELGDPDFVENPVRRLLSPERIREIRAQISPDRAGDSAAIRPGSAHREGRHTTHYSIADAHGNAVSVTYTLNDWFGARVTAAGTGILLNNEMDDFTAQLGVPNMYGLVQGANNLIAPGKRPLSSMTPTIVSRDGKPLLVLGTPGGSRIITAVLLTLLNVVDYGMDIQEAVDAPRFHQQWLPPSTFVETRGLSPDTRRILEGWGHRFDVPQPENHLAVILIGAPALHAEPIGKARFYGANDPRRGTGLAAGY